MSYMKEKSMPLILASSSPYRKALLERLNLAFECVSPDIDEEAFKEQIQDPVELAETLAKEKAMAILKKRPDALVIGSDQLLHFEGKNLGKAGTLEKAHKQLKMLSGKSHTLVTSWCIASNNGAHTETNKTILTMRNLSDESIKIYLSADNPVDCAGSYKLELKGISLFEKIETSDQTAIIGLPLLAVGNYLSSLGLQVPGRASN